MDQLPAHLPCRPEAAVDLHARLIEALYTEAMLLADEARAAFEGSIEAKGSADDVRLPPDVRVALSCESLKTTTRLMQVIAWLLFQRALCAGEISVAMAAARDQMLGDAMPSDAAMCARFPDHVRLLIIASEQLYARVLRVQQDRLRARQSLPVSPARTMQRQLRAAF